MKLSVKKYPLLKHLHDISEFNEPMFAQVANEPDNHVDLKSHRDFVDKGDVDYISPSFFKTVTDKLLFNKLADLFDKLPSDAGILLLPKSVFSQIHAISYVIYNPDDGDMIGELSLYSDIGRIIMVYLRINSEHIDWRVLCSPIVQAQVEKGVNTQDEFSQWVMHYIQATLAILTFKVYAEVEYHEIGGRKYPRRKKINGEKYINQTDRQINVLDNRWWTETRRFEAFKVKGHYRLQPYGPGREKRRLIYIKEFVKEGYHRRARKNVKQ
jgi:hypothetical protein